MTVAPDGNIFRPFLPEFANFLLCNKRDMLSKKAFILSQRDPSTRIFPREIVSLILSFFPAGFPDAFTVDDRRIICDKRDMVLLHNVYWRQCICMFKTNILKKRQTRDADNEAEIAKYETHLKHLKTVVANHIKMN
jgi:hypothetical protein